MLTRLSKYNNIPEHLLPKVPKPGTLVIYRALNPNQDFRVDEMGAIHSVVLYPKFKLNPFSRAYDPETNTFYPIVMATAEDTYGNILPNSFLSSTLRIVPNPDGLVFLTTGTAESDALYTYLQLSAFVKGNASAGDNSLAVLELVDYEAEAQKEIDETIFMVDAINSARELSDEDVFNAALVLGIEAGQNTPSQLRTAIIGVAKRTPKDYANRVQTAKFKEASIMRYALVKGVVKINQTTKTLSWANGEDGGNIMNLVRTDRESVINEWLSYSESQVTLKEAVEIAVAEHKGKTRKPATNLTAKESSKDTSKNTGSKEAAKDTAK